MSRHIEKLKKIFTCCGKTCSADTNGKALDELVTLAENGELGGGSANLTEKEIQAQMIRESVENGQAITPPDGVDGFSEITFPSYLLTEEEIVVNGTKEFGTDSAPFFPKKVTVNVPSSSRIETLSVNKNDGPIEIDCKNYSFFALFFKADNATGQGIYNLTITTMDYQETINSAGMQAGVMQWVANDKKLIFTPNSDFMMNTINLNLVLC